MIQQLAQGGAAEQVESFNRSFSQKPVVMVACGAATLSVHPNAVTTSGFHVQACAIQATTRSEQVSWTAIGF